jgi:predicted DNA-binding transcriptional regulator AlpA
MNTQVSIVVREREAAQILGVSPAALRRWRRERRGPAFVRLERCVGYRVCDLEEFVTSNTVSNAIRATRDSDHG